MLVPAAGKVFWLQGHVVFGEAAAGAAQAGGRSELAAQDPVKVGHPGAVV